MRYFLFILVLVVVFTHRSQTRHRVLALFITVCRMRFSGVHTTAAAFGIQYILTRPRQWIQGIQQTFTVCLVAVM